VIASKLNGWVFDPRSPSPLSELP